MQVMHLNAIHYKYFIIYYNNVNIFIYKLF